MAIILHYLIAVGSLGGGNYIKEVVVKPILCATKM